MSLPTPREPGPLFRAQSFGLYLIFFLSGVAGLGYEIVWTRMFAFGLAFPVSVTRWCVRAMEQVVENTVYSFASALSIYLLGTALYQRFLKSDAFQRPLAFFLQLLAVSCLSGVVVLGGADPVYRSARAWLGGGVPGSIAAEMLLGLFVFLVPTLLMGASFSHLALAARRTSGGIGSALGINTLGASLAPVLFGVVLMTQVGVKWSLQVIALCYLRGHWGKSRPTAALPRTCASLRKPSEILRNSKGRIEALEGVQAYWGTAGPQGGAPLMKTDHDCTMDWLEGAAKYASLIPGPFGADLT